MITLPIAGLKIPIGSGNQVVDTRVGMRLLLWLGLFLSSAMLHSAEIAITTLYPWKVKEFAEEEGERSPFQTLNKDVTRILTTILFATTMCSIYSAALFTNLAVQVIPDEVLFLTFVWSIRFAHPSTKFHLERLLFLLIFTAYPLRLLVQGG